MRLRGWVDSVLLQSVLASGVNCVLNLKEGDCWCSAWHGADVFIDNNRAGSSSEPAHLCDMTQVCYC